MKNLIKQTGPIKQYELIDEPNTMDNGTPTFINGVQEINETSNVGSISYNETKQDGGELVASAVVTGKFNGYKLVHGQYIGADGVAFITPGGCEIGLSNDGFKP